MLGMCVCPQSEHRGNKGGGLNRFLMFRAQNPNGTICGPDCEKDEDGHLDEDENHESPGPPTSIPIGLEAQDDCHCNEQNQAAEGEESVRNAILDRAAELSEGKRNVVQSHEAAVGQTQVAKEAGLGHGAGRGDLVIVSDCKNDLKYD